MNYSKYPAGSEWRKWDLHIHSNASDGHSTPAEIIQEAKLKGLSVIALTDHHTASNIDLIKEEGRKNDITVISGIEFRTEYGEKSVHIIGLFPDKCDNHTLDSANLYELILCPLHLTRSEIIEKGKEINKNYSNEEAFKEGLCQVQVDFKEAADLIHRYGGIVSVHAGSKANSFEAEMKHEGKGLKNVKNLYESLGPVKKELFAKGYIDICEIRKSNDNEDFYLNNFGRPSIIASDAHHINEVGDKFVWIKSDPTFEGLKQIKYEPKERVYIGQNKPSSKTPYLVIDKVKFIDKNSNFPSGWIYFNENLNSIIGGKSSGKSLLLNIIAKTVDKKHVEEKELKSGKNTYSDLFANIDFEVHWKDKAVNKLNGLSDIENSPNNHITYIPQLYINNMAESKEKEYLFEFINDILEQNIEYKDFINNRKNKICDLKIGLTSFINKWFKINNDCKVLERDLTEIGNINKIKIEISNLDGEINLLKENSQFSEHEKILYEETNRSINKKEIELSDNEKIQETSDDIFNNIISYNQTHQAEIKDLKENYNKKFIIPELEQLFTTYIKAQELALDTFKKGYSQLSNTLETKIRQNKSQLKQYQDTLKPLKDRIKNQEQLNNLIEKLEKEKEKTKNYEDTEIKLTKNKELLTKTESDLKTSYENIHKEYELIEMELIKYNHQIEPLELLCTLSFNTNDFEYFSDLFNLKYKLKDIFPDKFNDDNEYVYIKNNHIQNIMSIFTTIKENIDDKDWKKKLKSGSRLEDLFSKLFDDYFFVDYKLIYKSDEFLKMSPGKRGLVLLELILHLSNAQHPILIDQPEDNLDNRTVYEELKKFVVEKKKQRQIIMVTHNPNLVVSTDSENIIIANQDGQNSNIKENAKYKFEYVSGALEHTFKNPNGAGILNKLGVREHVCDILEGGEEAFCNREKKYEINNGTRIRLIPIIEENQLSKLIKKTSE